MISFDLCCGQGHSFEGWFSSSSDFDAQRANGLVSCPLCNDGSVRKLLSVPNIGRKGNQAAAITAENGVGSEKTPPSPTADNAPMVNIPAMPSQVSELFQKMAEAQSKLLKDSQWVGRQFAETARAIHYGEAEDRLIHGEASLPEVEALAEEGVSVAALPFPFVPPEAKN